MPTRRRRRGRAPLLPKLVNLMLGAGGRFMTGALLLCIGMGGLHRSQIADDLGTLSLLDPASWQTAWTQLVEPRLILSVPLLPELWYKPLTFLAAAAAGLALLWSSFQRLRWRSLLYYGSAVVMILGPSLGVPAVGPLDASLVSLAAGGAVSLLLTVLPWLRRRHRVGEPAT